MKFLIIIAVIALTPLSNFAQSSSASTISFQGALTGQNGQPLPNGLYGLTFKFYNLPTGGTALATSSLPNVTVIGGIASTPIPVEGTWFNGQTRYLGISVSGVNSGQELSPRMLVTSVPHSLSTRGIAINPGETFVPPIALPRPTRRVVFGTTTEDICRIPGLNEAIVIGTTNETAGTRVGILFDTLSRADSAIVVEKNNGTNNEDNTMQFYVGSEQTVVSKRAMTITQSGNVGIGSSDQLYSRLVVGTTDGDSDRMPPADEVLAIGTQKSDAGTKAGIYFDTNKRNGGGIIVEKVNGGGNEDHKMSFYVTKDGDPQAKEWLTITAGGSVGIGTTSPQTSLDVNGTTRTKVLQITGGADLAEHLTVTRADSGGGFTPKPGMVVSIDPTGNRKFKLSDEPYDRKRVGIISGGNGVNPGLILRDVGNPAADGEQPVALTGQVWCYADTAFGAITPGDLLTTSATPGHAMKVTDDARARFAVLGQALTGLKVGRGWVQVLVGKQ